MLQRATKPPHHRGPVSVTDRFVLIGTILAGVMVYTGWNGPSRTAWAMLLVVFAPGWTALRLGRVPVDALMIALSIMLSIAIAMVLSLVLAAALDWEWRGSAVASAAICAVGLMYLMVREHRAR